MTHNKKTPENKYSPKNLSVQEVVEHNKQIISGKLSGSNIKKLNNFNWLRHEISYTEPRVLFWMPTKEQSAYFDYSCTRGLGEAYDYILAHKNDSIITASTICDIHYLIAKDTNVSAGRYRNADKILEITVNGARIHTPDPVMIPQLLENLLYDYHNSKKPYPLRAFDLHYNLLMLHPFDDYNKRTSRMVMNLSLLHFGYRPVVFNRKSDKEHYRKAISNMANGDSKSYYRYMYNAMKASQEQIIAQLKTSNIK
ncbi:MAG: Fic family protein [Alphaproteobacteria bacterium]|nr:Fic family protein [Alphaproteobacteria bacterium]